MEWYHYMLVAAGILPALWVWMFIGGGVITLIDWWVEDDSPQSPQLDSDESTRQCFAVVWPIVGAVALTIRLLCLVRSAVYMPTRLRRSGKLPEAKVVKK